MKRSSISLIIIFAVLVCAFLGEGKGILVGKAAAATVLQAASGGLGGTWYGQMARLAEIINKADPGIEIKTVPGAGLSNPVRVNDKECHVAWGMPTFVKQAFEGTGEFKTPNPNIRGIATGFTLHPLQFLVIRDSGINSIKEITEKKIPVKIAIGRAGSIDEVTARLIIEYYGMTYDMIRSWGGAVMLLEYGEQVKKMQDRQANAYINMMPIPAPTVQEMMLFRPLKMLPLDPKMADVFREKYAFASQRLTKDMYGGKVIDEEMIVPAVDLCVIVNKDVEADVVYKITKAILENADQVKTIGPTFSVFNPARAWDNIGAPLHPGAEKYYREKKYIK